jgi:hypothetical protein
VFRFARPALGKLWTAPEDLAPPSPPAASAADNYATLACKPGTAEFGSTGGPGAGKKFGQGRRQEIFQRDGYKCVFCGDDTTPTPGPKQGQVDHADPKHRGGNNSLENGQTTCRDCNGPKGKWKQNNREYLDSLKKTNR